MYQSAKPPEVVHDDFLSTFQPSSTRSAPDEKGYQKWPPVSGSEYDSVPMKTSLSSRFMTS